MKRLLTCNLAVSLLALTLMAKLGFADPCGMVPPVFLTPGAPQLTRVGDQLTFVSYLNGIEDIVLRPGFKGSVTDFGMLIPFPVAPELSWKDAPDGTTTEHTYNKTSGVFTPRPPPPPRPTTWRGKTLEQITSAEAIDWIKARMAASGEKE